MQRKVSHILVKPDQAELLEEIAEKLAGITCCTVDEHRPSMAAYSTMSMLAT